MSRIESDLQRLNDSYRALLPAEVFAAFSAFRLAAQQHLSSCGDLSGSSSAILGPLSADVVHDLKARAALARCQSGRASESAVSEALASLFEAHAALGEALARAADPGVLVVPGLPG